MTGTQTTIVHERLQELLRSIFNDDELVLTKDLEPGDVPGWDSLAHVNVMFSIEETFGIEFSDAELERFTNIGDLETLLRHKLGG